MTQPPATLEQMKDLDRILIDENQIRQRVETLGAQISQDYAGRELVLVSVLKGGVIFLADLMRQITIPHRIELVGASCYKGGTVPSNSVLITKDVDHSLAGKDVVLVEDIYDTGNTLHVVYDLLKIYSPESLEVCAMLRKNKPHLQRVEVKYLGFDIEDQFVVGYGLDHKELYRNLPCIATLKPELYS